MMRATITIHSRGVVTSPAKLRQARGRKADDHRIAATTPVGLLLRPAVTLPLEICTPEREFDAAEAGLASVLAGRPPVFSPARAPTLARRGTTRKPGR